MTTQTYLSCDNDRELCLRLPLEGIASRGNGIPEAHS